MPRTRKAGIAVPSEFVPTMNGHSQRGGKYIIGGNYDDDTGGSYHVGGEYNVGGDYHIGGDEEYLPYGAGIFDDIWSGIKDAGNFIANDVILPVAKSPIVPFALKVMGAGAAGKDSHEKIAYLLGRLDRIERKLGLQEYTIEHHNAYKNHIYQVKTKPVPKSKPAPKRAKKGGNVILGTTQSSRPPRQILVDSQDII